MTSLENDKNIILQAMEYEFSSISTLRNQDNKFGIKKNNLKESETTSKCSKRCNEIVNYIWTTRASAERKQSSKDIVIMTTLRELFIYLIYLVILMIILFGMLNTNCFYYATAMQDIFINEKFELGTNKDVTFGTVTNTQQFWKFLDEILVKYLFWSDSWVNKRNETQTEGNFMFFENKLVGVARLRQVRSRAIKCDVPNYFKLGSFPCYDKYNIWNEDKAPIRDNETSQGWNFTPASTSNAKSYFGTISLYGGDGYIVNLSTDEDATKAIIADLYTKTWIDRATRAVFIDFTIYNANLNLFCKMTLVAEFPNFGGVITQFDIKPAKLVRYVTAFEYFILSCEIIFILFTFYYLIEQILEIKEEKLKVFKNFWNLLDMLVLLISFICIGFNVYRIDLVQKEMHRVLVTGDVYPQFDTISYYERYFQVAISITVFFAILKIFKYISFTRSMAHFSKTLGKCSREITGFSVMFLIVFVAFAQLSYLLFGSMATDYRELKHSFLTQFRIILGDFDYADLKEANGILGPIYFVLYVFFVFFVLINMFLAIICDNYVEVKHDKTIENESVSISTFVKVKTAAVLERMNMKAKKIMDIQEAISIADLNHDSFLAFDEWRIAMKKKGYADCEIEAVFSKYDVDGDQVLDAYEQKQMHDKLEEEKKKISETINRERRQSISKSQMKESHVNDDNEYVSKDDIRTLDNRVDGIEENIKNILEKLDKVLATMEFIETQKLMKQKAIGKILATFSWDAECRY